MNANDIWAGGEYAYFPGKGRGEHHRSSEHNSVRRVRAIRVIKRKADIYNERLTAYVEVQFLNYEGEPATNKAGEEIIREVKARDIASDWDEYWNEEAIQIEKRREKQEQHERELAKQNEETELIRSRLAMRGLKTEYLQINRYGSSICFPKEEIKRWLNIS